MTGNGHWQANARRNVNPIEVACYHRLLRLLTLTVIVAAPSVVYHYHVFVVFYSHHCPAMTDVHCEYLSVLHLALFLVSQRARQYFEDNLKESSV